MRIIWLKKCICQLFGHYWEEVDLCSVWWNDSKGIILECNSYSGHFLKMKCKRCSQEEILVGRYRSPGILDLEKGIEKINNIPLTKH